MQFLVVTSCNTNLISTHLLDRLPGKVKEGLEKNVTQGLMADEMQLSFNDILRLQFRLRELKIEETFVVSILSEGAILGFPLLS